MKNVRDPGDSMGLNSLGETGRRNETSVMFSLSALMAQGNAPEKPGDPARSTTATSATLDESGLIDLKALAESAGKPSASALMTMDVAPFPFEMPPAPPVQSLGTGAVDVAPEVAPSPKKRGVFVVVGVAVAVLLAAGAAFGAASLNQGPVLSAQVDLAQVTQHATSAAASIPPPVAAEPTTSAKAVDPGATKTAAQKSTTRTTQTRTSPTPQTPVPNGDKPATTPNSGQTGTKSSGPPCDLMCQMQRAAKGK
jgi:hypothetical protein